MTQTQAPARGRFDPEDGAPYGRCSDCREVFATEEEASAHMTATMKDVEPPAGGLGVVARGHGVRVTNPSRAARLRSHVSSVVSDAVEEAVNDLLRLTGKGDASEEEVAAALAFYPDFAEGWEDAMAEEAEDDAPAYPLVEVPRPTAFVQEALPIDDEEARP